MSQDDLLSQDEIDALLKGVSGEEETTDKGDTSSTGRIRPYDPATQHRIIRERLHALDMINERFARQFRMSMFNLLRRSADITVESVRYQSYSDFSRHLPVPTNVNLIAMKPLRGTALVVFPPSLVFMVVDNLFGGDGRFLTKSEGREFTHTEQRIIQRLLHLAIDSYQDSWKSVFPLEIDYVRSEMQVRFANITSSPNEIVVTSTFHLEVGNLSSDFQICMPYSMIEPVRDRLSGPLTDHGAGGDRHWGQRMAGEIKHSQVELVADFVDIEASIAQVMSLKVGDVLPIELPEIVPARVDGVPVMNCEFGSQHGQRALRVRRLIDHAVQNTKFAPGLVPGAKETDND
ncbi:flagellar motor switch protein FliM [Modicisalibacter ilicicola DSM 19980]|uniref:Flagellar motor switch protein FliM n=1 Tax=Modicisalibacter ilicicola DSM 19980 TaxID=1121942 RepID=A0A1M4Z001_9GAMM|nr:flagellar motor switch protein FliM [Halomonas ilicicola]SHF11082.1 flagellar motor switch protein FliM [Halomonas ilicicola DSM 19980]